MKLKKKIINNEILGDKMAPGHPLEDNCSFEFNMIVFCANTTKNILYCLSDFFFIIHRSRVKLFSSVIPSRSFCLFLHSIFALELLIFNSTLYNDEQNEEKNWNIFLIAYLEIAFRFYLFFFCFKYIKYIVLSIRIVN